MPVPDRHADELTAEIDRDHFKAYREAKANADAWAKEANRLRGLLEAQLGNAFAATIDGTKVLTYRPSNGYASTAIIKAYPDLVGRFMRQDVNYVLDTDAFARAHPEIAERYRIRSFREVPQSDE